MGCTSSTEADSSANNRAGGNPQYNGGGYGDSSEDDDWRPPPLSEKEISDRIEAGKGSWKVPSANYTIQYGFQSQRGYYPEALDKNNQDSFLVKTEVGGNKNVGYFGVYDGHGSTGDKCSNFVRDKIIGLLKSTVGSTETDSAAFDEAYERAYLMCNQLLHRAPFDDRTSGTTAVSAWVDGRTVKIANIGDSRAVVAVQQPNGKLVASPLSNDQTPYRKDERERCKASGARIMTMDQLDGIAPIHENWGCNLGEELDDGGDPPRIWAADAKYPGTAFTRSIGDSIAESLGVYAKPELKTLTLDSSHKFIIVASDGVWEFLTSQTVVDMVNDFIDDPEEACRHVVAEAYRLWLEYEVRTDDITMIVMKIVGLDAKGASDGSSKISVSAASRPVRRRRKRQIIASEISLPEDQEEYDITKHATPKTSEEKKRLEKAVKSNFLFSHLSATQKENVFSVMQKKVVNSGDVIIRQGDKGDMFYVVDSGNFDVYVAQNGKSPVKVMTYPGSGSFGELSIMYGKPRAATVVAASGGTLWTLERKAFRRLVMKSSATSLMRTLRSVDVLKALSNEQVQRLYDMLTETSFKSNEHIITQGDQGDEFFVIKEGTVKCTIRDDESSKGKFKEVLRLSAGEYFGERALLSSQPRAANVIAVGNVKCLQISRAAFEEVLGPLRNIIDSDRQRRESKGRKSMKSSTILPAGLRQLDIAKAGQKDFKIVSTVHTAENNSSDLCIVRHLKGRMFSMKRFNKSIVKDQNMGHRVVAAKDAMLQLANSRCIPEILATFIDNNCLHILMGTISCIMFDELLETLGTMAEDQARFYAQCAVSALQVLHARKIVLRAIYPEALTVDQSGYLLLSDFTMCKDLSQDGRTSTLLGNPEYLAPEMVAAGAGHGLAVDAWALGILIHELIMGRTPFESDNEKEIYDAIVAHKSGGINIKSSSSSACNSFINALLHPKDANRLGSGNNGATEIARHAWLKDANWADLESGRAVSPHADQVQAAFKEIVSKKQVKSDVATIPYVGDDDWFAGF